MKQSFYDVLDVKTDASPQEIREAYLRIKHAFGKDSVATYSLISSSEGDSLLKSIEEAYAVLSHDERRRAYDQEFRSSSGDSPSRPSDPSSLEDLLVAPKTDFRVSTPADVSPVREPLVMEIEILNAIPSEKEWRGSFIQSVRKAKNISIEELSDFAKVSKTYLRAIEDEDFTKLPAIVFVRGFLVQVCKKLKLPEEKLVPAYLERFKKAKSG